MPTGSIAFLPGVAHSVVHLENSRINVAENVISNQLEGPYGSELQQLMHYCSLGALVDSKEQYDAPQCEPETREAITQQVDDWGRNRDGKSAPVMWLRGGAGAGKSTLAQTIAMIYKREGILVGSFFFSNRRANRSDGSAMILTLVFQLLVTFPAVAPFIFQVIKRNPAILNSSPQEHMKHLFVGPLNAMNAVEPSSFSPYLQQLLFCLMFVLQSLLGPILGNLPYGHHIFLAPSSAKPKPCLIVIDGLDECNDPAIQCQLLRIIATAIPQLSQPLRFLVASRPEAHITRTFKQDNAFSAFAVQQLDLSADRDADADIERFLRRRFAAMRCSHPFGKHLTREWPSMSDIQTLVRRSSGHFIYPSTVMAFIEDPTDFPQHLFEAVLDPSKYTPPSDPFAPLNELYSVIFSRVKQRDLPVIQLFFGVLYLQNHHPWEVNKLLNDLSPFEQLHERLYMDGILQLPKGCLDVILQPLRSLLRIPDYPDDDEAPNNPDFNSKDTHPRHSGNSTDDNNSKLSPSYHLAASLENFRILHATLWDFLLDPARSNSYCIDLGWVHEEIAKLYINRIFNHRFPSPPSFSSNYRSFNNFVAHCKNSTISDPFIPLYLRTYDFLYDILIPSISTLDIDSKSGFSSLSKVLATILEFLDLVCRKDIDSTSQFRLYHVHRISKTLSANLHPPIQTLDIVQIRESADPMINTYRLLDRFNPGYEPDVRGETEQLDFFSSLLARWYPSMKLPIPGVSPNRDAIVEKEKNIMGYLLRYRCKAWSIQCGSIIHLLYWSVPNQDKDDDLGFAALRRFGDQHRLLIFTYDPSGRSFQSYATVSTSLLKSFPSWIKGVAQAHLDSCGKLLSMGEDAPWSSFQDLREDTRFFA